MSRTVYVVMGLAGVKWRALLFVGKRSGLVFQSCTGNSWFEEFGGVPRDLIRAALAVRAALYPELMALTVEDVCNQGA